MPSRRYYVMLSEGTVLATDNPGLWPAATRLTRAEGIRRRKAEAIRNLRKLMPRGCTVYTVLRHVSSSGMSRRISAFVIRCKEIRCLDPWIRDLGVFRQSEKGGLIVGGCGMDMGFHLVETTVAQVWSRKTKTTDGRPDANHRIGQRWI